MHIINTIKNSILRLRLRLMVSEVEPSKLQFKFQKFGIKIGLLIFIFCILVSLNGCAARGNLSLAEQYAQASELFYEKAVSEYRNLISRGKGDGQVYLKLGKLYFEHGQYTLAAQYLSKSSSSESKKYLAMAHYKLNDFTEALNLFEKLGPLDDDRYLYYYGKVCEGLNLYERAQELYAKIKNEYYKKLAGGDIEKISQINLAAGFGYPDIDIKNFIKGSSEKKLYPQASALILLAEEEIEVTEQDTAVYSAHFIIKILDERGKRNFSEVVIDYDSTYEKPQLEFARTIKPDGEAVFVGKKHIRDVSKYLNFPLYSNARALIISMPEITEGAIIEYRLKVFKNQLINKKDFVLNYSVQDAEPIIRANFTITVPGQRPLHTKTLNEAYNNFNAQLQPQVLKEGGRIRYKWQFKDIPQIIPESNMPPYVEISPILLVSTFDNWENVYRWWLGLAEDKMQADSAIKEKTKELIKNVKIDEEKARAVYNFCAKEIRYVAIEYGQAGYEPHKARDIFLNKYGDCKDQAVLLTTMLREAGLKAYPVLIGTKDYFNLCEDFPSVLFNHCIAVVELNGKVVFLDPTAETCSFGDLPLGDQARKVLVFKEEAYRIETIPLFPPQHNQLVHRIKLEINKNEELRSEKEVVTFGLYNQFQRGWFLYTQPELIRQTLEETIQNFSIGAKLEGYEVKNIQDLDKTVVLKYSFQGPEYWTVAGNLRILPQLASLDSSIAAKESRYYPIDFDLPNIEEIYFEISFPSVFKIKYLPENTHVDSPWLELSNNYSLKGNTVYFSQKKTLKKKIIEASEYISFKKFYQDVLRKIKQRIVLERKS